MRKLYALLLTLFIYSTAMAQTGELQGKVIDEATGQGIGFAPVAVMQNGTQRAGTQTDIDGNYSIKPIQPGTYSVKTGFLGYNPVEVNTVIVTSDKITFLDIKMSKVVNVIKPVTITAERKLVDPDHVSTGDTKTKDEIRTLATNRSNANNIVGTAAGVFQKDNGAALNIGGNRDYNNKYYVDGVAVRGNTVSLPASAIEQLTLVTGGIPARYGDATGGIINITTRGPSRTYNGGLELATSHFLDPYGYKLASANLSGPLFVKNRKTDSADSKIGFFLSAEYEGNIDRDPSAVGMWKVKDDVLADLIAHPLQVSSLGIGLEQRAQFVTKEDLEKIKIKQNFNDDNLRFTTKVDFKLNNFMNIAVGGSADLSHFNEDYGNAIGQGYSYHLFAPEHSQYVRDNNYRAFVRFTQRFASNTDRENTGATVFSNAFYTIQADYSKFHETYNDKKVGNNPFHYGYVGKFKSYNKPSFSTDRQDVFIIDENGDTTTLHATVYLGTEDTLVTFQPSDINPDLAAYTTDYYTILGSTPINGVYGLNGFTPLFNYSGIQSSALSNGDSPGDIFSLYQATGASSGEIRKLDNTQYRLSFSGSVDISRPSTLNKGERNRHAVEFGFEYEQRDDRGYRVFPTNSNGLWGLARQLTNSHIQLDIENPMPQYIDGVFQDTILYEYAIFPGQSYFDANLRRKLGAGELEFIDVNNLDPDQLSLDMFSPDELFSDGNNYIQYWGYDWKGNRLKKQPDFFDYWNSEIEDENGTKINDRPIGSFRPIYTAAYIQDKFNFKDLIFNVGVRVDRYDANQKVLKDEYSIWPIRTSGEVSDINGEAVTHPGSIDDDYVVYVNNAENPSSIIGYRDPDTDKWYDAAGAEISDPKLLANQAGGKIAPYLQEGFSVNQSTRTGEIEAGFKDYDPQWSIMPRIAFSFPISDEALFFAHYDVLTQRPSQNRTSPYNYYYWQQIAVNARMANPDLRPEKTIDYQVGFQQALGRNSALTLSLTYKELKNMVQARKVLYAIPIDYTTYGNLDFGTVKSFQASYEMRRTNNVRLEANYTLQFAEGTGSDQTSAVNLINSGAPNLRTIVPFSYDQRHTITATVDYRYGQGSEYNGPVWGKSQVFRNTGLNTIFRIGSGTPYSRQIRPTGEALYGVSTQSSLRGNINGSRLPYSFKIDARLDRDFVLTTKKDAVTGEPEKSVFMNAYLLVENLLDARNVISVYQYTGSADDDGYLSSAEGQQYLQGKPVESFTDLYNIKVLNPDNFSLPRRIRLGLSINF